MSITIYHNPRCSKSRKTLELLEANGIAPVVVHYLDTPPDARTILRLAAMIGIPVANLLRRGEEDFKAATDLPDLDDDQALANWLASHPKIIERPIVENDVNNKAIIGRPPENVLEVIEK